MENRVKMLHSVTGTTMFVPAELVDEYLAAGHRRLLSGAPMAFDSSSGKPLADEPRKNKKAR